MTGTDVRPEAQRAMMGMSAPEWSAYMRDAVGTRAAPEEINAEVVAACAPGYHQELPVLPGAVEAVRRLPAPAPTRRRVVLEPG